MKRFFILMPLFAASMSSCSTIDRMNCLVNESTLAIQTNSEAIAQSTAVIRQNAYLVEQSTKSIEANRHMLEAAGS